MLYNFVKVDIAYIILLYTFLPLFKILWNYSMVKLYLCSSSSWYVSPSCFKNVVKLQYGEEIDTVLVFIFYGVSFFFSLFFVGAEY